MFELNFIVAGFSKCGTTTLCHLLGQHPEIFMPARKEPWYFSSPRYEEKHDSYRSLFEAARPGQCCGEGSTAYTGYRQAKVSVRRIWDSFPNCRFILIARNPLKRIESAYRENHDGGGHDMQAPYSMSECFRVFPAMVEDAMFWKRIQPYRARFGDQAIHVLFLEDLESDPVRELKRCFEHLGVDPEVPIPDTRVVLNPGSSKLQDTGLFRRLRKTRPYQATLARLPKLQRDRALAVLRLRRPFRKPVAWDPVAIDILNGRVMPDAHEFLNHYGKPPDFWLNPFKDRRVRGRFLQTSGREPLPGAAERLRASPTPKRREDLDIYPAVDGFIVYDRSYDNLHHLNDTAIRVLSLCDGNTTQEAIEKRLQEQYHLQYSPSEEIQSVLERLRKAGMLFSRPRS